MKSCWDHDALLNPTEPKNSQGEIAKLILNKNKLSFMVAVLTPLQSMTCLLPNALSIGLTVKFAEDLRLFYSATPNIGTPKLVIDDVRLICQCVLLHNSLVNKIEARLSSSNLQIPFLTTIQKNFAISLGRCEVTLDISLRDQYTDFVYICFHYNEVRMLFCFIFKACFRTISLLNNLSDNFSSL